jgi:diaminobutyrate-2-oxoglutarate transaminase
LKVFERLESQVRTYSRSFPAVFEKAKGSFLYDAQGKRYIDFFCGAGSLNYGHNNPAIKAAILNYLKSDGVVHGLDMATSAKGRFLEQFESVILAPRGMEYRIQFTGPTGTNAVEAALKLARKIKKRSNIIAFTNSFHGLSSGSLAVTARSFYRNEAFINRSNVSFMPFDGYFGKDTNTIDYIRQFIEDGSSGIDLPAAVIVETVQAEGGVRVAAKKWLQELQTLCQEFDMLLIVDDIQVGCGRTGTFFSFEPAQIKPELVILSKSISGFGLPMSLVLIKPELDQWEPGEHTGTFRGNNLAFVSGTEALRYWENECLSDAIKQKSRMLADILQGLAERYPHLDPQARGAGLIHGFEISSPQISQQVAREAFNRGLIIELCGAKDNVLKFIPALTIEEEVLQEGLEVIDQSIKSVLQKSAGA